MERYRNISLAEILKASWVSGMEPVFVADCDTGTIVEANPAAEQVTGFSREELRGRSYHDLHPKGEHETVEDNFQASVTKGIGVYKAIHLLRKDGSTIPGAVFSSPPFQTGGRNLILGIFRDLSMVEEQAINLRRQGWALKAYARAAMAIARSTTSEDLMQEICQAVVTDSSFVLAWVGLAEESEGRPVRILGAAGSAKSYLDGLEISWDERRGSGLGPTGIAIRSGRPTVQDNVENSPDFARWMEKAKAVGIRSSISIPFSIRQDKRAVLVVYSSNTYSFDPLSSEVFIHLAEEIGTGLDNLQQAAKLERERAEKLAAQMDLAQVFSAVIEAISNAMESRDPYTAGHQNRVKLLSEAISAEMGIEVERAKSIGLAAMVHDIGKISIPAEILTNPNKLSEAEWAMLREHPEHGFQILKGIPFRWPIAEAVHQHHERMDGSGYPQGLKGDEILLGARIIAVADIVEAMSAARPYRSGLGVEAALAQIERMAGKQLDANVVTACLRLFRQKDFKFLEARY